jgi:hypothetical protein
LIPSNRAANDSSVDDQSISPQDAQAIARYRYLIKTAPPEAIELAHAEAFARLTPEQRQLLLQQIAAELPPHERALAGPANAGPQGLARLITRAEVRQPGTIERMLGGRSGPGLGTVIGTTLLATIAGSVIGSAIAQEMFGGNLPAGNDIAAAQADPGAELTDAADFSGEDGADIDGFDIGGFEI